MKTSLTKNVVIVLINLFSLPTITFAQTFDPAFTPPLVLRQAYVKMIKEAPGGNFYVAGDLDYYGTQPVGKIVRLTSTGHLDASFQTDLPSKYDYEHIDVLPNGNLLVVGTNRVAGTTDLFLLAPDGSILRTIDEILQPFSTEVLPDGSVLVGDLDGRVRRLTPSLTLDPDFGLVGDNVVTDIEVLGSQIYVSGLFEYVYDSVGASSGYERWGIARFNMDGTVDQSFNATPSMASFQRVDGILVQPDGKVIPHSKWFRPGNVANGAIRLNADGSRDTGFNFVYPSLGFEDAYYNNGKITVVTNRRIVRVNDDGSVDNSFQNVIYDPADVRMLLLPDNSMVAANLARGTYGMAKYDNTGTSLGFSAQLMRYGIINVMDRTAESIYIGGEFIKVNDHMTRNVARLNPNGSVLKKFVVSTLYQPVTGIEAFANARAIVSSGQKLYRVGHDGAFDPSFNYVNPGLPSLSKFIVQNDGKILVGGPSKIFRLNNNGSKDLSFNAAIGGFTNAFEFDFDLDRSTGKIIYMGLYDGSPDPGTTNLRRLNPNGSIDAAFVPQFGFNLPGGSRIDKVMFLDNLDLLVTGFHVYSYNGHPYQAMKVDDTGSVDTEFLDNSAGVRSGYLWWEDLHRFGNRLLLSYYHFYMEQGSSDVMFLDGTTDEDFQYPSGMRFHVLPRYFSDNATELFALGQITPGDGTVRTSIVKLFVNPPVSSAMILAKTSAISFYPNPASDFITVTTAQPGHVAIYNKAGKEILSEKVDESSTLNISSLPKGQYILQIITGGNVQRQQLIKE